MAEEMKKTLESVVLALPESYRTVVMLREVEGMSTAETAQCLDVSEDVVKTRLHRARSLMKEELFARTGTSVQGLFRFLDPRCNAVVEAVMKQIASEV